ncbi:hypothetical protein V6N11_074381 [Hibiscus sabdariffa]|uniref:Uncharacterized protein n=1 Tax=Hibiscus sabdariffa TaxID=183260 RepID=A0ABR2R3K2_9ROSI
MPWDVICGFYEGRMIQWRFWIRSSLEKFEKEKENVVEMEKSVGELEAQAEGLRTAPTERERLEKEKIVLEEDVKKFHAMITEFTGRVAALEKMLEQRQRELNAKEEERNRILEENQELKKRVELQIFNARDVERMKREMQAVEKDIVDAEMARNSWEDKSWDLDSETGQKLKELMALAIKRISEIFPVVADTVSKYKKNVESTVSKMRVCLSETAAAVSDVYKATLPSQFTDGANASK